MQSFFTTFQQYIIPSDIIILAVSGGVDSMVLLDMVKRQHSKKNIVVAHFDHSLRGVESDSDRELVEGICKDNHIQFEVKKMDIRAIAKSEKMNIEAVARRDRYAFLERVRAQYHAAYILTAHHAVDQSETILGNMIKGAKVRGLSGMPVISGYIFRPLLSLTKQDILRYSVKNTISYHEDSTNSDISYDRNRLRHEIIPVLETLNPSIHTTFGELGFYMQELSIFMRGEIELWLQKSEQESGKPDTFLISSFLSCSPFFQSEIVSYLYIQAESGSSQGLSRGLIDELTRFISDPGSFGKKEIKKLRLERRGERIIRV